MPNRRRDHSGKRYGRLLVQQDIGYSGHARMWRCLCDCGTVVDIPSIAFRKRRSCGCSPRNTTHRLTKSKIYRCWADMKARCTNPKDTSWRNYGGRGISICEEWKLFDNFYRDMGPSFETGLTIERVNNDGNYEPSNCCWIPKEKQRYNQRRSIRRST